MTSKGIGGRSLLGLRPGLPYLGGLALAGLVMVLYYQHWRIAASTIFLTLAWCAILVSGYYLWIAGLFVAASGDEDGDDHEGFDLFRTHAQDLELEKSSLLKAIKEVEFDNMMGKMSDRDASELSQLYKRRAVEILKELDEDQADNETLTIADRIERDVRARAQVSSAAARGRAQAERARKKRVVVSEPVVETKEEEE